MNKIAKYLIIIGTIILLPYSTKAQINLVGEFVDTIDYSNPNFFEEFSDKFQCSDIVERELLFPNGSYYITKRDKTPIYDSIDSQFTGYYDYFLYLTAYNSDFQKIVDDTIKLNPTSNINHSPSVLLVSRKIFNNDENLELLVSFNNHMVLLDEDANQIKDFGGDIYYSSSYADDKYTICIIDGKFYFITTRFKDDYIENSHLAIKTTKIYEIEGVVPDFSKLQIRKNI